MLSTTSLLWPNNVRQWSVNHFRPRMFNNQGAVWWDKSIIKLSATFLGTNAGVIIITLSWNDLQRRFNGASIIFDLASCIIYGQWNAANPQSTYQQPVLGKILVRISCPPPTVERPQSVNNVCGGSASYTTMNCIAAFLNWVLRGQSFRYVLVYHFTHIPALSHKSKFFAPSSRVNI